MGERGASVEEIILEKLKDDKAPDQVANLVIRAMRGGEEIEAAEATAAPPPDGALRLSYLKAITVEGFRGIGPQITLPLQPGPGLTLVTGRNGRIGVTAPTWGAASGRKSEPGDRLVAPTPA